MAKKLKKGKKKLKWWNNGQMDIATFIIVMILVLSGLVMILSASSPSALSKTGDSYRYIKTQLMATVFGIVIMYGLSRFNYHKYRKLKWIIYGVFILLLALVKVFGISAGRSKKMDSYRWSKLPTIRICKSWIYNIFCCYFSRCKRKRKN